jgi:site-specific recombinase XerD
MGEESGALREGPGQGDKKTAPRLLDQLREAIRRRYYSRRTEEAYVHWVRRFIYFSGRRHPRELGEDAVTAFLSHLAVERNVAVATQNQALSAILFLYRQVLELELGWLKNVERASRLPRTPTVLSRAESSACSLNCRVRAGWSRACSMARACGSWSASGCA